MGRIKLVVFYSHWEMQKVKTKAGSLSWNKKRIYFRESYSTEDGVPVNLGRQTKVNIEIYNMTIPTTELQEDAVSGTGTSNTPS